jgi:hypothetical protein
MKYQKSQTPDHHIRWQNDPTRTSQKQFRVPEHLQSGIGIVKDFERACWMRASLLLFGDVLLQALSFSSQSVGWLGDTFAGVFEFGSTPSACG